jgi:hypothetical protein
MARQVCQGALCQCTFGTAPGSLKVTTQSAVLVEGQPASSILDCAPMTNIPTFGMCTSLANPAVAAATAAANGVLTPMPCVPNTPAPWTPGSTKVSIKGAPALDDACQCLCVWAGVITIAYPGQPGLVLD